MELRPEALANARMNDLLHQLGRAMTGRTGVPVTVATEGESKLPPAVQPALYRIAQEALKNVGRHAEASQVDVRFHCEPDWATLSVSDDGQGFEVEGIMRERAAAIGAQLEIESRVDHGTKVVVVWVEDQAVATGELDE